MYYAVIKKSDHPVAVIVHDPQSGRLVFKGKPGSDLHKAFESVLDRPLVVVESKAGLQVRKKVKTSDETYLFRFLDKVVHLPYRVQEVNQDLNSDRIDPFADRLESEYLR